MIDFMGISCGRRPETETRMNTGGSYPGKLHQKQRDALRQQVVQPKHKVTNLNILPREFKTEIESLQLPRAPIRHAAGRCA
jgi:hypothetical protein